MLAVNTIHTLDARKGLRKLSDESVDCVITSPPYWSARDYGDASVNIWDGDESCKHEWQARPKQSDQHCTQCGAWRGQLGLEPTYEMYTRHLLSIFDDVKRVLKSTGTCWVNLGDTYAGSWGNYGPNGVVMNQRLNGTNSKPWLKQGIPDTSFRPPSSFLPTSRKKSLCCIPERFMLGMLERGWLLRNRIVWHKPNHMPASVKDRFTSSWEHLLMFVKAQRYFFDLDAVRVPHKCLAKIPANAKPSQPRSAHHVHGRRLPPSPGEANAMHPRGKNPADYWSISPETRSLGAMIGVRGAVKVPSGSGWVGHPPGGEARIVQERDPRWLSPKGKNPADCWDISTARRKGAHFAVFPEKLCERPIRAGCPANGLVLDPFVGSGTTAVVAKRLGRRFIGLEINPDYVKLANQRLQNVKAMNAA